VLSEAMEHYGLAHPFDGAGFFETEHHQKTVKQMKAAIQAGRLVALSGVVGAGKTVLAHRLQEELAREGKVLVAKSLSVDKERVIPAGGSPDGCCALGRRIVQPRPSVRSLRGRYDRGRAFGMARDVLERMISGRAKPAKLGRLPSMPESCDGQTMLRFRILARSA
jgi:ABC-type dipeptide/oligopeptide/nickel transport system ATPase component